jgi:hypothetical protein
MDMYGLCPYILMSDNVKEKRLNWLDSQDDNGQLYRYLYDKYILKVEHNILLKQKEDLELYFNQLHKDYLTQSQYELFSLSEEYLNSIRMTMDPSAIPDLSELMTYVDELIAFVELPEMETLRETNYEEYERLAYQRFNQFIPIKIIGMMVNQEERYDNLERLLDMFERLEGIKNGSKDMQHEYADFSEKLNEQYLYPEYGGKEQFIEAMKKNPNAEIKELKTNIEQYLEIDGDIVDDIMYVTPRIEHKSQVATIEDPRRKYIPFNSLETENLVVDDYVIGYFAANPKWDYWARGQLNEVFSSPQPYRLSDNKVKKLHNGNYDGDVEYVATVEKDNKSQEPDYLSVEFGIINGRKLIVSFSVNGTTSKITNRGNWPRIISTVVEIIRNEMPKIIRQYSLSVVVFSSSDTYLGMFTPRKYSRSKLYTKRAIPFMTQVLNSNFPGQWQHEGVTSRDYESFYIWTKIQDQD